VVEAVVGSRSEGLRDPFAVLDEDDEWSLACAGLVFVRAARQIGGSG
jgi:hypothetical protein